ncbi:MAG: hypothetical protein V4684_04725 [Pseudomonadota bacterium]
MPDYEHALAKALDAAAAGEQGPGPLSTGEALMAALALNRPDWLARTGYTIVEALERIGEEWRQVLPQVARAAAAEQSRQQEAHELAEQAMAITRLQATTDEIDQEIFCEAQLVTCGSAPGYRDARLTFDVTPMNSPSALRVELRLRPQDGEPIARHLREVHELAWRKHDPFDVQPGERRPRWIDAPL